MLHFKVKTTLTCSPELIVDRLPSADRRVLLFGETGRGKSTLAVGMAQALNKASNSCDLIGADPSLPLFGVPSAACLGHWQKEGSRSIDSQGDSDSLPDFNNTFTAFIMVVSAPALGSVDANIPISS